MYTSTRNTDTNITFNQALLKGMDSNGGLYIPRNAPPLEQSYLDKLKSLHYAHIAAAVMKKFAGEDIPSDDIALLVHQTYNSENFHHPEIAPLVEIGDNLWIMELFHGPTLAFKDYALQLLGRLFDYVLEKNNQKITIVGATSGDTGSAAIEACRYSDNINIFILHPKGRVSDVQRKQMTTVNAPNVKNLAIEGTFDDCQAIVKGMFADEHFKQAVGLSAVNSINWARICAQIAYYVAASLRLNGNAAPIAFSVPTGNFGNVYAAHCARKMGINIENLIIGTNKNDIITQFFTSGEMRKKEVSATLSPSMDIQVSSNFERYLFELMDGDAGKLTGLMKQFSQIGRMSVSGERLSRAQADFKAARCGDENTIQTIKEVHAESGYVLDPHSAIGVFAAKKVLAEHSSQAPVISLACAHPCKFPEAVKQAIGKEPDIPERLAKILDKPEFIMPMANDLQKVKNFVRSNI